MFEGNIEDEFGKVVLVLKPLIRDLLITVTCAVLVGVVAKSRGYCGVIWFLASLFTSPALTLCFVAGLPNRKLEVAREALRQQLAPREKGSYQNG